MLFIGYKLWRSMRTQSTCKKKKNCSVTFRLCWPPNSPLGHSPSGPPAPSAAVPSLNQGLFSLPKSFGLNRWLRHNFWLCYISHCLLVIQKHTYTDTHTHTHTLKHTHTSVCIYVAFCFFGFDFAFVLLYFRYFCYDCNFPQLPSFSFFLFSCLLPLPFHLHA